MKKIIVLLVLAALTVLTLASCAGDGWSEVTTAVPASRPGADGTVQVVTTAPVTVAPIVPDETTLSDTTAEPGSLTGAWEGTYTNGDYKIVITRTNESDNYITIKLSGGSLPNLTIGQELLADVNSFADSEGFGVAFSKNGDSISVVATPEKIAKYTGTYKKQ